MTNQIKILTLLGLGFCFGLAAVVTNYTATKTQRDPAAAGSPLMHISDLNQSQIRSEILNRLKVHPTSQGEKKIELNGFSTNLCTDVKSMDFVFAAEGVSVAGEPPRMEVAVPCEAGLEGAEIADMNIPVAQMTAERFQDKTFEIPGHSKVTIKNSADGWPTTWVLIHVNIHTQTDVKHISFDRGIASESGIHPVVLEF